MKNVRYPFLVEELERVFGEAVYFKPIFGSYGAYCDERILFILREKNEATTIRDDGLWIATEDEATLKRAFPMLRPIEMFADRGLKGFTGWLILPKDHEGFEELALELCALAGKRDPRIGKLPKSRVVKKAKLTLPSKPASRAKTAKPRARRRKAGSSAPQKRRPKPRGRA